MGKRTLVMVAWSMVILAASCTNEGQPSASASPALEDGRHFGYIQSAQLTTQPPFIVFDLAYLLSGDEANQAAADRRVETPVPNDYFIVNDNPRLRELPTASDLRILLLDWTNCCDTMFRAHPQRFQESFDQETYPPGNYRGTFSGYWLTVRGGVVTRIEEQYFP